MSDFLDMLKADAYVSTSYEYTDTGGGSTFGPTAPVIFGPLDFGEEFTFLDTVQAHHYAYPDPPPDPGDPYNGNVKTIYYFINVGHIMPMQWTVERKTYDDTTDTLLTTDTLIFTLINSASFTFETTEGAGTYATFIATFKSPS